MDKIVSGAKNHIKYNPICADSITFKLHYKVTFSILVVCAGLVTAKQYIGDPIDCIVAEWPNGVMDTYCWVHSTFTVPTKRKGILGHERNYFGIAPVDELHEDDEVLHHNYYQWVWAVLILQAGLSYLPRKLWKQWEGDKIKTLVQGMHLPIVDKKIMKDKIELLVNYFTINRHNHDFYFFRFFFCETLNFIIIVVQIYFMDVFLDGQFSSYGIDVLQLSEEDFDTRSDPMARLFPKMAKCTAYRSGPSGTIQTFDGLCVLPLNIVNEKIYVFLWFWFVFIALWTGVHILYRLVTILIPGMRCTLLKYRARLVPSRQVEKVCKKSNLGDWFLLCQLGKNLDSLVFKDFMNKMNISLDEEHPKSK